MRIAVTGATGNIGTSLIRALAGDDRVASVRGIARRRPEWSVPGTEWVAADLAEDDLDPLFSDRDAVVHLGWLLQPARDPAVTWRANAIGSKRVFEAAARAEVKSLIYSSSIASYSPRADHRPVDESWPTDGWPGAAYSREKAYVERLLDLFEARHPEVRTVRFRPGFVFKRKAAAEQRRLFAGPFLPGRLATPRAVPAMPVVDGIRIQAVHADDLAEAFRSALFGTAAGAFNVAGESDTDMRSIAAMLGARPVPMPFTAARAALATAYRARLVPAPPELLDVLDRLPVMDTARVRSELGWVPHHSADEALGEFIEGLRSGAGLPTPPLREKTEGGRAHELATGVGRRP
ncbi:NAD-dependent epimerase/dehydratase family protein [Glycomyces xiaoerkulensis]|uniref:NAD-dependent epimerase/dehydratase family protein n=1 Tax=Glycomyces xiaoerkulensis TaxID=2038139 RepID=UPI000C2636FF|nr:NAD-dependent epimerase/dehydratase family protein [Glycomyces xiaoerkulensis]